MYTKYRSQPAYSAYVNLVKTKKSVDATVVFNVLSSIVDPMNVVCGRGHLCVVYITVVE